MTKRETNLKHRYGLSLNAYTTMYEAQGGKCAICGDFYPQLHVDHSHATGTVRELLCRDCNLGLAAFEDDPVRMRAAAAYLREYSTP